MSEASARGGRSSDADASGERSMDGVGDGSRPAWRVVFFGSSEFSIPALEALVRGPDQVVLVVAPPPAPCGRGCRLAPSPLSARAECLGLDILPAKSVKNAVAIEAIRAARPDLLVVAAYGGFLPDELLTLTPYPPLNIHPSLLPRHRGAAPVNWSLIQGDREVGVSVIFLQGEMDAGPILRQRAFPVAGHFADAEASEERPMGGVGPGSHPAVAGPADGCFADAEASEERPMGGVGPGSHPAVAGPDSAGVWEARLARIGAEELLAAIAELKAGTAAPRPQDPALATVNRLLKKEDGRVDWTRPAEALAGLVNGVDPWPGAATTLKGRSLKLFGAEAVEWAFEVSPGRVLGLDAEGRLVVAAGRGALAVTEVQPEGKKRMAASAFLCGYRPEVLGS